ncbi:hypothetical protein [Neisseria yangbaofengii]|uniref:hypothetical protein n=1 Tax=Neisseria yangbaofengii TaxID=2709396 RepID=UPI0013EC1B53|nr:hypothetical protein [Neisseria yangbaofengii]
MDTKKPSPSSETENDFNWERRLEQLRQTRQINAPYAHAPLIRESKDARRNVAKTDKPYELDQKSRDKVLKEYMRKWQEEHNVEVAQHEDIETDDMVLLQENWLSAQNALQMRVSEKHIESTRTVWLNPKRQTVEFPGPQDKNEEAMPSENMNETEHSDGLDDAEQKVVVNINILNPQAVGRREVFCISEQELAERLIKRMRPHVTDAVNGMIRVALQKQMALLSYNLQQTLNEQAPALVEDLLDHNVKKVLADLKYEMKYKREK